MTPTEQAMVVIANTLDKNTDGIKECTLIEAFKDRFGYQNTHDALYWLLFYGCVFVRNERYFLG